MSSSDPKGEPVNPTSPADGQFAPLGLIGVGLLGTAIAERLLKGGWPVVGWDINPQRVEALQAAGGTVAGGVVDIVENCERVLLSLPSHEIVAKVLDSTVSRWRAGQFVIDTSTGAPRAAVEQANGLSEQGVAYLDATVSGSSQQLRDGEAILMVGATAAAFEACQDIFAALAPKAFHVGPPGNGARMKLVTNLVLGLNRAALAEGLVFAREVGIDPAAALRVLCESAAYSRVMEAKGRKMIDQDFQAQARLSQHLKDVRLILEVAEESGLALRLSQAHRILLEQACADGWGELDNSAIIRTIGETGAKP